MAGRIELSLFTQELRDLINATAKIFPISMDQVANNLNPDGYEYGRIDRSIYRWNGSVWQYIVADDIEIHWSDILEKPISYTPSEHAHIESDITDLDKYTQAEIDNKLALKASTTHTHDELHAHDNKQILDELTQTLLDRWNTVADKAEAMHTHNKIEITDFAHTHTESNITDLDKYTKAEIDSKLLLKSDTTHNHDGAYYKKSEIDSKLLSKAAKVHTHIEDDITDLDKYTQEEVNTLLLGKAESVHQHVENDIANLDKYTQEEVNTLLLGKAESVHTHADLHNHTNKELLDKLIETVPELTYDLSNLAYIDDIRNGYTEGHTHTNLTTLEQITDIKVDGWDSAVTHISDAVKHITVAERNLWNTVSNKSNIGHVHDYSEPDHAHDDRYYTELEIDTALESYSPKIHMHSEVDITDLDKYSQAEVNTLLNGKADKTTLSYHTNDNSIHVTTANKTSWDSKAEGSHTHPMGDITGLSLDWDAIENKPSTYTPAGHTHSKAQITDFPIIPSKTSQLSNDSGFITAAQIPDVPPSYKVGTVKPTDGSLWIDTN